MLAVALGWFLTLGARFLIPAVLPAIKTELSIGNTAGGVIVTVIWLTYGLFQYPAGSLIDSLGERVLLAGSTILAAASLIGIALAPDYWLLLLGAAGFGIGTGLYGPARGTALTKSFDEHEGMAFGAVLAAGSIGAAALPFFATLVTGRWGWQTAVIALVPAFVLVGFGLWRSVPSDLGGRGSQTSIVGGIRASFDALSDPVISRAVAAVVVMLFVFQGLTAFFTTYLHEVRGLDQGLAGGLFALLFLTGAGFQLGGGRLADSLGYRTVLVGISAFSVVPLVLFPFARGDLAIGLVTVLIAVRLAIGPLTNALIVGSLSADTQGTVWGFIRMGFFAVGSLGSVVVGVLGDLGMFDTAFFMMAGLTAIGAVFYWQIPVEQLGERD